MIQAMKPSSFREDPRHSDGGASLVHLGLSLFGNRSLRIWGHGSAQPQQLDWTRGDVYISNPGAFEHQVVHRDVPEKSTYGDFDKPLPDLLDFGGMGPCKVAVQLRCSVFKRNRGTNPPASPIIAFQAASAVVAWLVEAELRLPSLAECQQA